MIAWFNGLVFYSQVFVVCLALVIALALLAVCAFFFASPSDEDLRQW